MKSLWIRKIMILLHAITYRNQFKDILYLACATWVSRYHAWCVCSTDAVWYWAGCRCQLPDALLQDYGLDCIALLSCNNIHRSLATCRHIPEGPVAYESGKQEALKQLPATLNPSLHRSYNQYLNEPDNKVQSSWLIKSMLPPFDSASTPSWAFSFYHVDT